MKRIYISGQITGTTDFMERFAETEEYLTAEGYSVINPAKVNSFLPEGTTWKEYMKMSFCMMELCDSIYMMKGWRKSKGATREYYYARSRGMEIIEAVDYGL